MSRRLARVLERAGAIEPERLGLALQEHEESGDPLDEVVLRRGDITEEKLLDVLAEAFATRVVPLPETVTPEVIALLPPDIAFRHVVLPLERRDGTLVVAGADPTDLAALEDIKVVTGLDVELVLARRVELLKRIEECFGTSVEQMIANMSTESASLGGDEATDISDLRELAREPTVINLVNLIIFQAVEETASDIHIEPFEGKLIVRYRVDGLLREISPPPKHLQSAIVSRIKIMAGMDIAERYTPQDGHIRLRSAEQELDLRVSTVPTVFGESIVMRILNKSSVLLGVEQLGLVNEVEAQFLRLLQRSHGIILVTGPTGSGKTTTLYAALNRIKNPALKIITIEEPVEYNLEGINQMGVNVKRGLTFANGLRAIVRQDPDVIMVGEIRDGETAEIAIRSALTGHLVFSTLHTNSAAGAVTRLLDMGVPPYLISSSVTAVLAQRLVRVSCRECLQEYQPEEDNLIMAGLEQAQGIQFVRGKGCDACRGTGFRGRLGVFELLEVNDAIRELILTRPSTSRVHQASGHATLRDDGWLKVRNGTTTVEELVRVTAEEVSG